MSAAALEISACCMGAVVWSFRYSMKVVQVSSMTEKHLKPPILVDLPMDLTLLLLMTKRLFQFNSFIAVLYNL